jgi:hypothetical protein
LRNVAHGHLQESQIGYIFPKEIPLHISDGINSQPDEAVKPITVESTAVERVAFDERRRVLKIEFRNGRVYNYLDVPPRVYKKLMQAPSIGTFVNLEVKGTYEYEEL